MSVRSKLESHLGLTRGDVTVTLFIVVTTLIGFIYITFFDSRPPATERRELAGLVARHDSVVAAHKQARLVEVAAITSAKDSVKDSVAAWKPLTVADESADEAKTKAEKPSSGSGKKEMPSGPINVNAASKADLMKLPGVGEKTAETIMERRIHIPFRRAEDMMEVKGIGEKKFEKMKPYIRVK